MMVLLAAALLSDVVGVRPLRSSAPVQIGSRPHHA